MDIFHSVIVDTTTRWHQRKREVHILHVLALKWTVDNADVCCMRFNVTCLPFVLSFYNCPGLTVENLSSDTNQVSFFFQFAASGSIFKWISKTG